MEYLAQAVDVAVIGAGHAGIEAALAASRLGVKVMLFTLSIDAVANLPCNPSVGGTAKGHLVREIDALGGEMAKAADAVFLQSRMLNKGKGPAVHSLRTQVDRIMYGQYMKSALENAVNVSLKQAEVKEVRLNADGEVCEIVTALGARHKCGAVIIATGTFLGGRIFVGDYSNRSGPDGLFAPTALSECLISLGVRLRRFKTGTPARIHSDSIDYSKLERQAGDEPVIPMSFITKKKLINSKDCHIAYTNENTHRIIRENIHRSPLYGGDIKGVGPRYCPSIEDKVVRFADKTRHQLFVEPVGRNTKEMYIQGLSTSLPEDVQIELYRSIEGFENAEIIRNAYAIEYDCADPLQLRQTLEFAEIPGLFGAGQFNGTSGYEEAAAQGLIAGVNAAHRVLDRKPFILDRMSSYIGTLIDDLVTKGCNDPYRMMTSRSEYRLLLRQDNADTRLTPIGREIGLVSDERWDMFHVKQSLYKKEMQRLEKIVLAPSDELNETLTANGTTAVSSGVKMVDLMRRPQISYEELKKYDTERPSLPDDVIEQIEVNIKYEGYITKQLAQVEQAKRLENKPIPDGFDYGAITGLRLEAREKLSQVRPVNVGQASRISGVSPADISVLLIYMCNI